MTLKELRQQNKKTVQEVAQALNIGRSTYSNYEQGIRRIGLELIIPLSKIFDCSAEDIITAQLNSLKDR